MGRTGQVYSVLLLVFSQRSRSLTLFRVTSVSRLGWTILVCTQAWLFLAKSAWADPFRVVAIGASNTSGWIVVVGTGLPSGFRANAQNRGL